MSLPHWERPGVVDLPLAQLDIDLTWRKVHGTRYRGDGQTTSAATTTVATVVDLDVSDVRVRGLPAHTTVTGFVQH